MGRRPVAAVRPAPRRLTGLSSPGRGSGGVAPARSVPPVERDAYFGATSTWRNALCGPPLLTVIVVPVFGTFTPYHPGW